MGEVEGNWRVTRQFLRMRASMRETRVERGGRSVPTGVGTAPGVEFDYSMSPDNGGTFRFPKLRRYRRRGWPGRAERRTYSPP